MTKQLGLKPDWLFLDMIQANPRSDFSLHVNPGFIKLSSSVVLTFLVKWNPIKHPRNSRPCELI